MVVCDAEEFHVDFVHFLKERLVVVEPIATQLKAIIFKCLLFYCFSRVAAGFTTSNLSSGRWRSSTWNSSAWATTTGKSCWTFLTSSPLFQPSTFWRRTTRKFLAGLTNLKVQYRCIINLIYGTTCVADPGLGGFLSSGSGIRVARISIRIRNPESGMNKDCSKRFVCLFFGVKILKFFEDPGWR